MNQFDRDQLELGWRVAMALWLENGTVDERFRERVTRFIDDNDELLRRLAGEP
jgi:hypothetical protein